MRLTRLAVAGALVLASCGGPGGDRQGGAPGASGTATQLTGAGATFPNPIYSKWFDAYAQKAGTRINYQSIGSGGGIRQFTEGTVDFGATDGPMSDEQIAAVNGNVLHIPTVLGAVVLTYNLPSLGNTQLRFDGPTIAGIYLGRITRWNDNRIRALNPGVTMPDAEIIVVHRSDGSGTSFIFTDYLRKVSSQWQSQVGAATSVNWPTGLGGKGNEGVTQQVKQVEGTIGYVELIYAISNNLPVAAIRNQSGAFVTPSLETTTAAAAAAAAQLGPETDFRVSITNPAAPGAYPIASFTWLLVKRENPDAARAAALQGFLQWMVTDEAQAMAAGLHYAPLPAEVRQLVQQKLANREAGAAPATP